MKTSRENNARVIAAASVFITPEAECVMGGWQEDGRRRRSKRGKMAGRRGEWEKEEDTRRKSKWMTDEEDRQG